MINVFSLNFITFQLWQCSDTSQLATLIAIDSEPSICMLELGIWPSGDDIASDHVSGGDVRFAFCAFEQQSKDHTNLIPNDEGKPNRYAAY